MKPASSAEATYSGHTYGSASAALTHSASVTASEPSSAPIISRRRSNASASAPPSSAKETIETNCVAPTRPTATVLPVSSYICTGIATSVIAEPSRDTPCPIISSRSSRRRRSRSASTATARKIRLSRCTRAA
jgi:hypothetical protein